MRFTGGIHYDFSSDVHLPAGERLVIVRDRAAFLYRHSDAAAGIASGAFLHDTALSNGGESIVLTNSLGGIIRRFTYDDAFPWPISPEGRGDSLVLIAPTTNPDHGIASIWRSSTAGGGSPGFGDAVPFTGNPEADADHDGLSALLEHAIGTSDQVPNTPGTSTDAAGTAGAIAPDGHLHFSATRNLAADDIHFEPQLSTDLDAWSAYAFTLISESPIGVGFTLMTWRSTETAPSPAYARLRLRER